MRKAIRSFTAGADESAGRERAVLNLGLWSGRGHACALDAFEGLRPGGSFEIVAPERGGRLVADLQARYGPRFYWWPLERGPHVWRAILAKPALGSPATVAAAMAADHLRLQELWGQFERAVELCRIDAVHRRSAELLLGLRRHLDIEEAVLFPLLEAQTQMRVAVTTDRMRQEHRGIASIAEALHNLRTAADCTAILQMFDRPVEPMTLFQQHCCQEEAALYPLMNLIFNSAEERELLAVLQAFEL